MKRTGFLDSLLLVCLASLLILPLFRLEYMDNWASIESTFISDARMLANNLPHPGWQPLWYCGTRFDYIYPPALRYGTALIAKLSGVSTARAYHLYTAIAYVLGIAGMYWLVRIGARSRASAFTAAILTALVSPSFLLLPVSRNDSAHWVPQRLHVLAQYGEGPHISALCVLPFALAAAFLALRHWRPVALAAAGALCAFTVANNFYGATALAIFFPIAVWSVWIGERSWQVWVRAGGIILLAYGFSAFWLTPSYVAITLTDLKYVSQPGSAKAALAGVLVAALFCAITWRVASRRPDRAWPVFVSGLAALLSFAVLGFFYFGARVFGESARLVPELDLALTLLFVLILQALWNRRRLRAVAVVLLALALLPSALYLRHAWSPFPPAGPLASVYDYQVTKWIQDHLPGDRVLPVGTIRFWYNAWSDNPQTDGGSNQGLLNQILPVAFYQFVIGDRAAPAVLWLQALGTEAVVVPEVKSREPYRDFRQPEKFAGQLPVLFDDGQGTRIYRIPRIRKGLGRVVDTRRLQAVAPLRSGDDLETLGRYVAIVEDPHQPAALVTWDGFDRASIETRTIAGQSVLFQETYDPAWHAYDNGQPVAVRREPVIGFMLADVTPGPHRIEMRFETPLENRFGQILFLVTLLAAAALVFIRPGFIKADSLAT